MKEVAVWGGGESVQAYTRDMKSKLKHNTWLTKEYILRTELLTYFENKKTDMEKKVMVWLCAKILAETE